LFYEAEGRFFEKVKLYGAAESAYLIALKYSNNKAEYLQLLGDLKNKQYDYKNALSWYAQLFKQRPDDVKLLQTCAITAYNARAWSKASFYYGKLLVIDSLNSSNKQHYQYAVKQAYDTDSIETLAKTNIITVEDNKVGTSAASSDLNKAKTVVPNTNINFDPQPQISTLHKEETVKRKAKVKSKDSSATISGSSKDVLKQDSTLAE
jgi:tetratricopeptide (TPR) repeat protein